MLYDSHDITSHKHCHEKHDHCLEVGLCDDQLPVLSSAGIGPQGDSIKVILHEDGQQISYQNTVLGTDGVWREETVTDDVILTQYVETIKVSGRTKEETTLQLSDNINGGLLYHTYNYRPYTSPPSFTLTFWYLRNDTHEITTDGAHSYVAWRFTTRPIPYLPDFENEAGSATVGTGVGALYIRGSIDDEWISKLIYPEGAGPAEGSEWPTGGPVTPNNANTPAPKAIWSVNLTLGVGGDIDIPNIDDLAKILGWSPDSLKDLVLNGTNEDYLTNVLYPDFNSVKDYIDTTDNAIKDVIQPPEQWETPGLDIGDGFGPGTGMTIYDKLYEMYLDVQDQIGAMAILFDSGMTYTLNMAFESKSWTANAVSTSNGYNYAWVGSTGRFGIAFGQFPDSVFSYIDWESMDTLKTFNDGYLPRLLATAQNPDIKIMSSGLGSTVRNMALSFQGHTMGDDPAWADGAGDHVWWVMNTGDTDVQISIPYPTRINNANVAANAAITLKAKQYMSSIDSFARLNSPPIKPNGSLRWSISLPIAMKLQNATISLGSDVDIVDFGLTIPGYNPESNTITITNVGSMTARGFALSSLNAFIIAGTPPQALAPGDSFQISVSNAPGLETGSYEEILFISARGGAVIKISLSFAVEDALYCPDEQPIVFSNNTSDAVKQINIQNISDHTITGIATTFVDEDGDDIAGIGAWVIDAQPDTVLAPGASTQYTLRATAGWSSPCYTKTSGVKDGTTSEVYTIVIADPTTPPPSTDF